MNVLATGKMNFHLPSLQEYIPECYKSTEFMHNWKLHELGVYDVCIKLFKLFFDWFTIA